MNDKETMNEMTKTTKEIEKAEALIKELERDIVAHKSNITYLNGLRRGLQMSMMVHKKKGDGLGA